jgi:hypothetical protein
LTSAFADRIALSPCHALQLTTAMQAPEGAQIDLGKAQVIDSVPKVIKELKFGVLYVVHPQCAYSNSLSQT